MRLKLIVPMVALSALLAACGSSSGGATSSSAAPTSSAPPSSSSAAAGAAAGAWSLTDCAQMAAPTTSDQAPADSVVQAGVSSTKNVGSAPTLGVDATSQPATSLVTVDVVEGKGKAVDPSATVTVNYCGVGQISRQMFDSSWVRGEPATFPLNGVIKGWQDGLVGMKPGGRRLLIIPGDQAYGPQPPPGSGIQPNETLIFIVDLQS